MGRAEKWRAAVAKNIEDMYHVGQLGPRYIRDENNKVYRIEVTVQAVQVDPKISNEVAASTETPEEYWL